jgi:hypothetical protein
MEAELKAIESINEELKALPLQAQGRVVNYVVGLVKERFDDAEAAKGKDVAP